MNNAVDIARITVSGLLCVAIVLFNGYDLLKHRNKIITPHKSTEEITAYSGTSNVNSTEAENSSTAVTAAATSDVKGKIISKFSTPYTANTNFNNVFLKNSTGLDIDLKSLLESELQFKIEKSDEPQVLIVHSHATECFMTENRDYYTAADRSRSTDNGINTVALGKIITERLNVAGIKTLHSETQHDNPDYNYSYTNCAKTVKSYLEKYPSIKIVIDLHRDAVGSADKVKLTTEIGGKTAAQVMLVMGSQSGDVTDFPNWQENLKLAVKLQQTLEVMYPSLARALSLVSNNYNESLTTGSMLIEMGTDANSLEEVKYSAELVSNALISLLNTIQ